MSYQFKEEASRFVVQDSEEKEVGEITYTRSGDDILIIDHTGVEEKHRGQGLAAQLVEKVVEKARKDNLKIMPLCPFAKSQFDENKEYQEVQHE